MTADPSPTLQRKAQVPVQIPIASIKSDPELQPRAVPYVEAKVEDYAIIIKAGGTLPPIEVVERDGSYTIVTGHNRLEAHKRANRQTIEVELIPDTGNSDLYGGRPPPATARTERGMTRRTGKPYSLASSRRVAIGFPTAR